MNRLHIAYSFAVVLIASQVSANDTLLFNRDVRPILSDRCYACHGPDEHSREANLRLDQRASALATNEVGAAVVAGNPELSKLVARILSDDPDVLMPPPTLNKPLTPAQKDILVRWIKQGAKYEQHWSFVLPRRNGLPPIEKQAWPQNAIDHFILARLENQDLAPSPEAKRETLIRRVTLDLTGLPPTPKEVDAFLSDQRDDAYERLVDRLMKTTAYAERRAQDWLDLARYADTRGFADDKQRVIWPWRDWVIRALDRNMPFDQFTIEQLAGDMLPDANDEQRLATAFHRNAPQARGMTYPVEEYRIAGVVDRVNTVGRVWLGLTMDCAACHDHKFDPITQRDYYSIFAIFNNIEHSGTGFGQGGPTMKYTLPTREKDQETIAQHTELQRQLDQALTKLPPPKQLGDKDTIGRWNGPAVVANPDEFSLTDDLTITAKIRTTQPVADIVSKYDWRGKQRSFVFGIGGEGDADSTPGHLYFWVSSQAQVFDGITVYSSWPVNDGRDHHVAVEFVAGESVRLFIDGVEDKLARTKGNVPSSIAKSDRSLAIGSGYNNSQEAEAFRFQGKLSNIRLSDRALGNQISVGSAADNVLALRNAIRSLQDAKAVQPVIASVPVMRERTQPRETFIHIRGEFRNKGERVSPAAPAKFGLSKSHQPSNRLEFARWLVGGKNPLVARVVVNRFWQSYFGHGLVRTADDFGAQGKPPTHPQLLDWLAAEFMESGWDMKHIHRLIVTSATYRQSAKQSHTDSLGQDPENLLLSRMPRVRLAAEQIRDQALAVSGLLVRKVGGPPVFPVQPKGYWERRILPGRWTVSTGDDRYRRTLYTYWRRMALHPSLEVLNAPARENCVVQRSVSNIPTQALVLMNDPMFHETAVALASRVIREANDNDADRIQHAFRVVLGRLPTAAEREKFRTYVAAQRHALTAETSTPNLAAWTLASTVLLNLDETITRP